MEDLNKKLEILHLHEGQSHLQQLARTAGSVPFVPFGARHVHGVLERQLGNVYGSKSRSNQVLVHRRAWAESETLGLRSDSEAGLHLAYHTHEHTPHVIYNVYIHTKYNL